MLFCDSKMRLISSRRHEISPLHLPLVDEPINYHNLNCMYTFCTPFLNTRSFSFIFWHDFLFRYEMLLVFPCSWPPHWTK